MLEEEQVSIPVIHSFSPGIYAREIRAPKGVLLLGHKHKRSCLNILAQGKMLLKRSLEDEGKEITAPFTFHTDPGTQKIAICLEDVVFINVFNTEETDIQKLEDMLIEKSEVYIEHEKRKKELS